MTYEKLENNVISADDTRFMFTMLEEYKTRIQTEQQDGTWKKDADDTVDPVKE
jgi:hypothetical protein